MPRSARALTFLILVVAGNAFGSLPTRVPTTGMRHFVDSGLFEGGDPRPAVLAGIDVTALPREAVERWIVSFAGEGAPRFRLRFEAAQMTTLDDDRQEERRPARFVLLLRSLRRNLLTSAALADLVRRSRFVSSVIVYPSLEDGDTAIELVLRKRVLFEPYQPAGRDGRLVIDLADASR